MLGKINIYFGKVISVDDESKLNRIRVSIPGHTDKNSSDDLPWYFPFYGLNYLPVENDEVSVLIFDNNFSSGFYGRKINLSDSGLDSGDYANYLEIFKRDKVSLTYKESTGIEFINSDGKIQVEVDKVSLFVSSNSIVITSDRIDIGNMMQEATILGDKGVKHLQNIILHQMNTIIQMNSMMSAIASSASANPLTANIGAALAPLIPVALTALQTENQAVNAESNTIQSKKVFIE